MPDKNEQTPSTQPVTLNELVLTAEDVILFDKTLAEMPYRLVKPLFDILNTRLREQGQAKLNKEKLRDTE